MNSIVENNRRLLCHHCGAVFEDKEAEKEGPPYLEVTCPWCGYGWFSSTEEAFRPPTKTRFRVYEEKEKTYTPEEVEALRTIYWIEVLETWGIVDDHILHYMAALTAKRELKGYRISLQRLYRQSHVLQLRRAHNEGHIVQDDDGSSEIGILPPVWQERDAELVALEEAEEDSEALQAMRRKESRIQPIGRVQLESSFPSPEDYLIVDEVRKIADEVWEKLNNTGRPREYGGWNWEDVLEMEYPGKDAPIEEKRKYKAAKMQLAKFRERLQEALDETN